MFNSSKKRFQHRSYGRLIALQTLYQEELNPGSTEEYGDEFVYSELNQLCLSGEDSFFESEEEFQDESSEANLPDLPVNDNQEIDEPLLYHELIELVKFVKKLIEGTRNNQQEIDAKIAAAAENWSIFRMSPIDRNILRIAVFEMLFEKLPKAVVISEAVKLGKKLGSKDSSSFINGILDKIDA